jgi:hypothetical protein
MLISSFGVSYEVLHASQKVYGPLGFLDEMYSVDIRTVFCIIRT